MIGFIIFIITILGVISYAICFCCIYIGTKTNGEDEEQIKYIKEWREKHGRK